jgi:hypothetical protein
MSSSKANSLGQGVRNKKRATAQLALVVEAGTDKISTIAAISGQGGLQVAIEAAEKLRLADGMPHRTLRRTLNNAVYTGMVDTAPMFKAVQALQGAIIVINDGNMSTNDKALTRSATTGVGTTRNYRECASVK